MIRNFDVKNNFAEIFDPNTGFYVRSGVYHNGVDTGVDPFMRSFPSLIDIGVMGRCKHGLSGKCLSSGVECYQDGYNVANANMTLDNFKKIIDESKGKVFQVALGGRGDVDQHENFEELLNYCRDNNIVPNFTSSGLGFTKEIAKICSKYVGAVAISYYRQQHTFTAMMRLLDAGVKTNIHYVLGNNSIDEAMELMEKGIFDENINAIIFLLHKPVGLGTEKNVLSVDDPKVKKFFNYIDNADLPWKIGFDSCTVPGLINYTKNIHPYSLDTCEGARWSMYISSDMKALPCSFDNDQMRWVVDLNNKTILEAWQSDQFENFRDHFRNACPSCKNQRDCFGGCPITKSITLCNKKERTSY